MIVEFVIGLWVGWIFLVTVCVMASKADRR